MDKLRNNKKKKKNIRENVSSKTKNNAMFVKCYISEKYCGNRFKVKLALCKPLYKKSTNAIK